MRNTIYLVAGWTSVGLGLLGIALPLLPTTPFILLAAGLFTRGSPRARSWIMDHARFGPLVRDWEDRGAIPPRAKAAAGVAMALVLAVSLIVGAPLWLLAVQAVCLGGAAAFVLTRPS